MSIPERIRLLSDIGAASSNLHNYIRAYTNAFGDDGFVRPIRELDEALASSVKTSQSALLSWDREQLRTAKLKSSGAVGGRTTTTIDEEADELDLEDEEADEEEEPTDDEGRIRTQLQGYFATANNLLQNAHGLLEPRPVIFAPTTTNTTQR